EPTASATSEPTATMMPTETPAPTETQAPVPTETTAPVPTATTPPEPTATTPPEPTATNAPMIANTAATSQPVDLTGEEEHATPQPTATPEPSPTATATVEPSPTESPAPEPTSTPEDSGEAPPIVPVDGANVIEAPEDVEATATSEAESTQEATPDETDTTIQPISTSDGTGGGSDTPQRIEPIGGTSPESTSASEETPESTEAPATETSTDENAIDLDANSEAYGGIAGDPSGRLVLDDGRMEYQPQAHPAILTSGDGLKAETEATSDGQAVVLCSGDECADVSSESADGPSTDTPLSWINGALIYVRDSGGRISYHALVPNDAGTAAASDTVLYDGGADLGPTFPVYRADNQVWVITQGSGWLALTDGTAHLYGDDFGSPRLLRFAATGEGSIVAYVADGKVIVATTDAPGSPIGSAPFNGVDFDVSPGGSRIVVSTGSAIEIYDLDGNLISTYASPDMQPGTVLWLNSGVVFQNEATGTLMQIPDPES
ncbi:MAG TPA: hypothetical protein VNZ58_04400, partial [Thermomicrobiales bacterium]|nr:hypothetical protein [Thermomicrobiales bacterium]